VIRGSQIGGQSTNQGRFQFHPAIFEICSKAADWISRVNVDTFGTARDIAHARSMVDSRLDKHRCGSQLRNRINLKSSIKFVLGEAENLSMNTVTGIHIQLVAGDIS